MSNAKRRSIKKKSFTSFVIADSIMFFVLGYQHGQEIVDYWNTTTGKAVMIPIFCLLILALVVYFMGRKLTAPMRRKKELQNLQLEKERKEVEKLDDEAKAREREELGVK